MFALLSILFFNGADAAGAPRHLREEPVTNTDHSHPFFNVRQYDPRQNCYSEFMSGSKVNWAACCEQDGLGSVNCAVYYPYDICYDYIEVGMIGVNAGHWFQYPNQEWDDCCEQVNNILEPETSMYCRPLADQVDTIWDEYKTWIILGIVIICVTLIAIAMAVTCCCCGCCGCGGCGRRNRDTTDVHVKHETPITVTEPRKDPVIVYAPAPAAPPAPIHPPHIADPSPQMAYVEVPQKVHCVDVSSDSSDDAKIDLQ